MQKPALPYVAAALVGALVFVVLGYLAFAASADAGGAIPFSYWINRPFRFGAIWWLITGLIAGPVARYAFR